MTKSNILLAVRRKYLYDMNVVLIVFIILTVTNVYDLFNNRFLIKQLIKTRS